MCEGQSRPLAMGIPHSARTSGLRPGQEPLASRQARSWFDVARGVNRDRKHRQQAEFAIRLLARHRRSSITSASSSNIHQSPTKFCGCWDRRTDGWRDEIEKARRWRMGRDPRRHRFPRPSGERITTINRQFLAPAATGPHRVWIELSLLSLMRPPRPPARIWSAAHRTRAERIRPRG
jgi:hypothetical protein